MTAGLVTGSATANTDVRFDKPEANLNVGKVRSSVEITDSCNCFKLCPCIGGRKVVKQKQDNHIGTVEIARSALEDGPVSSLAAKKKELHPDWNKPISHPHITVDVHVSSGDMDVEQAKEVQKGNFS